MESQQPESLETVLNLSTEEAEPKEAPPTDTRQPSVQVVRKGKGASGELTAEPFDSHFIS